MSTVLIIIGAIIILVIGWWMITNRQMSEDSKRERVIVLRPPLANLHRYLIAANKMRIRFQETLAKPELLRRIEEAQSKGAKALYALTLQLHTEDYGVFMFYWYSGLYVVIEGFKELGLHDEKIEALLQSPNVDSLRLVRNATFHFQKDAFLSNKLIRFMGSEDSVAWVCSITDAFNEFFLRAPKL